MRLREIAHSRTGDKGNTSNISVIAYDEKHYPLLLRQVTSARVKAHFAGVVEGEVVRYELPNLAAKANEPYEVRVRVTGRTENLREAIRIGNEVETLYTNGPAAGGGAFKSARDVVAVASVLLPRELARPQVHFLGG